MPEISNCPRCGRSISNEQTQCTCGWTSPSSPLHSRESDLAAVFLVLVSLFLVTGTLIQLANGKEKSLAQYWYRRGNEDLAKARFAVAIDDFSNSLVYSRDNNLFELRLAEAFVAAGRLEEARGHLEELWDRAPSSGIINLELARLAAKLGDAENAVRYYNNAIYGVWDGTTDQQERRRDTQFELYRFLATQGQNAEADALLMTIAAGLPANPALHVQVGKLMYNDGLFQRALEEFRAALQVDRTQRDALAGAGESAFQLGDYPDAVRYLDQAVRGKNPAAQAKTFLDDSRAVIELDPFDPRIGAVERARRASRAFGLAVARLKSCARDKGEDLAAKPPQTDLQDLYARATKTQLHSSPLHLERHPDEIASLMDLSGDLEEGAAKACGESSDAADRALVLIARRRGGARL